MSLDLEQQYTQSVERLYHETTMQRYIYVTKLECKIINILKILKNKYDINQEPADNINIKIMINCLAKTELYRKYLLSALDDFTEKESLTYSE